MHQALEQFLEEYDTWGAESRQYLSRYLRDDTLEALIAQKYLMEVPSNTALGKLLVLGPKGREAVGKTPYKPRPATVVQEFLTRRLIERLEYNGLTHRPDLRQDDTHLMFTQLKSSSTLKSGNGSGENWLKQLVVVINLPTDPKPKDANELVDQYEYGQEGREVDGHILRRRRYDVDCIIVVKDPKLYKSNSGLKFGTKVIRHRLSDYT